MESNQRETFIRAIQKVFRVMLKTDVRVFAPQVKKRCACGQDVSAIIGFGGEAYGNIALCFPLATGLTVAEQFAEEQLIPENPLFADALGELANMVAGQARRGMGGTDVHLSLPRLVVGKDYELLDSRMQPVCVLPCESPIGDFSLEVMMDVRRRPGEEAF